MSLDKKFLSDQEEGWLLPQEFYSNVLNARGLYDPIQFALRLRRDIRIKLDSMGTGIRASSEVDFESLQAFSTYLHESIHWWQHIGSTLGLMLSLIYPTQAHINHRDLLKLLNDIGPYKSILTYNDLMNETLSGETDRRINRILNNWHDIEFFRWIVLDPQKASIYVNSPYFESLGHTYEMAWSSILWLLSSTFDPEFEALPDIRAWENEFSVLQRDKTPGFFYGSDIVLSPIGARDIFEGQARFSQIQYLYFSSNCTLNWEKFKHIGMLEGVYQSAFYAYLNIIDLQWPSTPDDPLVGLFLLVCDIAINPTDGFPFDIYHFPSFINSVDPGTRFLQLCWIIKRNPRLLDSIQGYTKEEYIEVSEFLCKQIVCKSPLTAAETVVHWSSTHSAFKKLLEEDSLFQFSNENLPVRVLFARFLRYQRDKLEVPEYFCWPGVWFTSARRSSGIELNRAMELFQIHSALFVEGEEGDIYPRIFPDKDEQSVHTTFNSFYTWNVIYELTRQWIVEKGDFNFNFSWLTTKYTKSEITEWVTNHFEKIYGVNPTLFRIV